MSCKHGNHEDTCDICDEVSAAYESGLAARLAAPAAANAAPVDCVERVARAICSACEENPDHQGDARGNAFRWQDYVVAARAALAAQAPQAALTDDAVKAIADAVNWSNIEWDYIAQLQFARHIEAAAAPNAGLVEALENIANACNCCGDRADLAEIAADALAAAGVKVAS